MSWQFDNSRPIYLQIAEGLKGLIISGKYAAGDRLPSVRDLAGEIGVNPNTMQRALAELEHEGLVYSVRTSGRFITTEQSILTQAREEGARSLTQQYLSQMEGIGYTREQTVEFIVSLTDQEKEDSI